MSISSYKSSKDAAGLSVSPERAERFLERLANLDRSARTPGKVKTFSAAFGDLLPRYAPVNDTEPLNRGAQVDAPERLRRLRANPDAYDPSRFLWEEAQPCIQAICKEPSQHMKESALLFLAGTYMREKGKKDKLRGRPTLVPDKFLLVLLYALKHVHLLRYCANPDCKEPHFVARRGSQIYCSSPCAEPAQREAKSKWWREHGDARRKKSRKGKGKHAKAT